MGSLKEEFGENVFKVRYTFAGASGSYSHCNTQKEAHAASLACMAHYNNLADVWIERIHLEEGQNEYKIELEYLNQLEHVTEIHIVKAENLKEAFIKVLETCKSEDLLFICRADRIQ